MPLMASSEAPVAQVWDINASAPEDLGDAYDIVVASNVLHLGTNLAGALYSLCVLFESDLHMTQGCSAMLECWAHAYDILTLLFMAHNVVDCLCLMITATCLHHVHRRPSSSAPCAQTRWRT